MPTDSAHAAADAIRRRLAEDQYLEEDADDYQPNPIQWRPVALVLVASAVCFMLGQQFGRQDAQHRPLPPNSLPATVGAIGRPLFTEAVPGQPRHRLTYQRHDKIWYLDTDADGDGRFEGRRAFRASGND